MIIVTKYHNPMRVKEMQKERFATFSSFNSIISDWKISALERISASVYQPTHPTLQFLLLNLPLGSLSPRFDSGRGSLPWGMLFLFLNSSIGKIHHVISWNRPPHVTNRRNNELHLKIEGGSALQPPGMALTTHFYKKSNCVCYSKTSSHSNKITLISLFCQSSNRLQTFRSTHPGMLYMIINIFLSLHSQ